MTWSRQSYFCAFCFSFRMEVTHSLHVFHLLYIGKQPQSRNLFLYYLVFKRNNCFVKTLFIVFFNVREITMSCSRFKIIFPLFGSLFSWWYFTPSELAAHLVCWLELMILHTFINFHVYLTFIRVWFITSWYRPTNVTFVDVLSITSVSYLQG